MTKEKKMKVADGFTKQSQDRINKALAKKAEAQAKQIPQLPPELSVQIANGIALAMQGKFSNIKVGLGTKEKTVHVRVLIFQDEMDSAHVQKQPLVVAPQGVPGSAIPPVAQADAEKAESEKEYEVAPAPCEKTEEMPADVVTPGSSIADEAC